MSQLYYQPPSEGEIMYATNWYTPSAHFAERYRERMAKHVTSKLTRDKLLNATDAELARRANYMLLFSIHGRKGETKQTEVRFYFDWNIVVDNEKRTIVTMYIDDDRKPMPARLFGDRKIRKLIYNLWFKPNSKYRQDLSY